MGTTLKKSKKVFDSSKVTDHHAIIPTGVNPSNGDLTYDEKRVYDLVARRFIAVFYPDCKFATTTVQGKVEDLKFKATGKQILDDGWRAVFGGKSDKSDPSDKSDQTDDERTLPDFKKGERGPHEPTLAEKWTTAPKPYTEATLLRAMETAGKTVENDELRDAMKENGIGRPSTRAAIIETLFRRGYIRKVGKSLNATPTGIDLIGIIHEELLKSAELTGQWEKKLRDIEARKYEARQFLDELKAMVFQIVQQVLTDGSNRRVAAAVVSSQQSAVGGYAGVSPAVGQQPAVGSQKTPKKRAPKKKDNAVVDKSSNSEIQNPKLSVGDPCPLCGKGHIIKGHTAYGCSEWKAGCQFRQPF